MPLYDFACKDCGKKFEALVLRNIANPEPPACPDCQGQNLEQLVANSFAVDSAGTREANSRGQKAKNAELRKDYQRAQAEYERNHHH